MKARAYFLVGPTAVGKTAVAQCLAEGRGWEILSADSMVVYRGMDIGTAKPTPAERGRVRYWGLDLVAPGEPFNVALFLEEARRCFVSAGARGIPVIVVGGTGLYIKALLEGLEDLAPGNPEARAHWEALSREEGVGALQRALRDRAPAWYEALSDTANTRRLIRALECAEAGQPAPPPDWGRRRGGGTVTGLAMERERLAARIEARVRAMYDAGLLEETRRLFAAAEGLGRTALQAIGYAEAWACLQGRIGRDEAMRLTAQRTRQLAKRQMTWFRHQVDVAWIPVKERDTVGDLARGVAEDWERRGAGEVIVRDD
jgi:tRNA dimethylallyltransferase